MYCFYIINIIIHVRSFRYVNAVDKALKNFEYSSEWADLIAALGKLNKVKKFYLKFQKRRIFSPYFMYIIYLPKYGSMIHLQK